MPATVKRYVSAIPQMDARAIRRKIFSIENNIALTDVLEAFGRLEPVTEDYEFTSWTDTPLWQTGVTTGTVTGSGTPTVTFTLTTATSLNRRKNDMIMLPNGKNAYVTNVVYAGADATVTATSPDATNLTLVTTNTVKFNSNAVGEMSENRDPRFYGYNSIKQYIQQFRETCILSDVQKLSKIEAENGDWSILQIAQAQLSFKTEINVAHFNGQIGVSNFKTATGAVTDPTGGGITQFERGMYQYITAFGATANVATPGTWILDDFDAMTTQLTAKKAGSDYMAFGSRAVLTKVSRYFKGIGSSGLTNARLIMDSRNVDLNVDKVSYGGFDLQLVEMPIFNQPDLLGGTDFDNGLFWVPLGSANTYKKSAGGMGSMTPKERIRLRYIAQPVDKSNHGSALMAEYHGGMMSPINPEGSKRQVITNWQSEQAIEILGPQHFAYQGRIAR